MTMIPGYWTWTPDTDYADRGPNTFVRHALLSAILNRELNGRVGYHCVKCARLTCTCTTARRPRPPEIMDG